MWYDETYEDDILTIEVYGTGGGGGGDVGGAAKAAADMARWYLKAGGTVLVASGGVIMVAGGVSAWTGGGAGLVLPGMGMTVVGAGSLYVGYLLDKTVEDPPQPDYAKHLNMRPAAMTFPGDRMSPMQRALDHLNHLCVLAPNSLDAMERQQGAALAGDKAWANAWTGTMNQLHGLSLARTLGYAHAIRQVAAQMGGGGNMSQEQVAEGIKFLQSAKGRGRLEKSMREANMPDAILEHLMAKVKTLTPADYPAGINLADALRSMCKGLAHSANHALSTY